MTNTFESLDQLSALTSADVQRITSSQSASDNGASRTVFDLGSAVLKVNMRDASTYGGCAEEASVWNNADVFLRQYLAPVIASDPHGQWLVMAKCGPVDWDAENVGEEYEELKWQLNQVGIIDQHEGNVMVFEDRLVSVDYAYLETNEECTGSCCN